MKRLLVPLLLFLMVFDLLVILPSTVRGSAENMAGCYWFKDYHRRIFNYQYAYIDESAVAFASNGDIIVVGDTNGFGAGNIDAWVMRVNRCGEIVWFKSYGGSEDDIASSAIVASNGDIILAGWTGSFIRDGDWDLWVLRLDGNGSIKWQKDYGGSVDDGYSEVSLAIAPNGDIIVATTTLMEDGYEDMWILRLDENGDVVWESTYGGEGDNDYAVGVGIAPNGDIVVAGITWVGVYVDNIYINGAWVLRLDPGGNILWQKIYGRSQALNMASGLVVGSDGDIVVGGSTGSLSEIMDNWLVYLDGYGNVKWSKTYVYKISHGINELSLAPNGDIIGRSDYIIRVSGDGGLEWAKWMIDGDKVGPVILPDGTAAVTGLEGYGLSLGRFNIDEVPGYTGWNNPNDAGWNGWGSVDLKVSDVKLIVADSNVTPRLFNAPVHDINVKVHDAGTNTTAVTIWSLSSLTAPRNLKATAGEGSITLSWDPPVDNCGCSIVEYKIYRGTNSGNESYYASVNGSITTYTDNNVAVGQTYYYKVSAVNSVSEGPKSNEISATPTGSSTSPTTSTSTGTTTASTSTSIPSTGVGSSPASTSNENTGENTGSSSGGVPQGLIAAVAVIIIAPIIAYIILRFR